jgi:ABC-type transport system involved in multi-copper enzyme maturation permease subunit
VCPVVLVHDLIRSARRDRSTLQRCAYAAALLSILWVVYGSRSLGDLWRRPHASIGDLAVFASTFFAAFVAIQMLAVVLLTPLFVAGAVAEEKERDRLDALLATALGSGEIVLSFLVSRLARLVMVLLSGFPVLSFLQFMGGIDPNLVIVSWLVTGITALSIASVAILVSIHEARAYRAIVRAELLVVGYLVGSSLLEYAVQSAGALGIAGILSTTLVPGIQLGNWSLGEWSVFDALSMFNNGNPAVVVFRLWRGLPAATPAWGALGDALLSYATFHGFLTFACLTWAVVRLRLVASRQRSSQEVTTTASARRWRWRRRLRSRMMDQPLFWKGVTVEGRARTGLLGQLRGSVFFALFFWPPLHAMCSFDRFRAVGAHDHLLWLLNDWCRLAAGLFGAALLLAVAVRSAGSISGERERQTLDSLLVTPLSNRSFVVAKWLAAIIGCRSEWLALLLVCLVGLLTKSLQLVAAVWLLITLAIDAAFVGAVGVWASVSCPGRRQALLRTVFVCFVAWTILLLAAWAIYEPHDSRDRFGDRWQNLGFGALPPVFFSQITFPAADVPSFSRSSSWAPALVEELVAIVAAGILVTHALARFRRVTGRSEDSLGVANQQGVTCLVSDDDSLFPAFEWRRRLGQAFIFLLPIGLLTGWDVTKAAMARQRLATVLAELERQDPHWRLKDIEAERPTLTDNDNSALRIQEAVALLPEKPQRERNQFANFQLRLKPEERCSKEQWADISKHLRAASRALEVARSVRKVERGRYPISWTEDALSTVSPHRETTAPVCGLLELDVLDRAERGDIDGAVDSCLAMLNAARSIGDEPLLVSQLVRQEIQKGALLCVERVLAQGQPSAHAIETLLHMLDEEHPERSLCVTLRACRAGLDQFMEALGAGAVLLDDLAGRNERRLNPWRLEMAVPLLSPTTVNGQRAAFLDLTTQLVNAARLPTEERSAGIAAIAPPRFDLIIPRLLLEAQRFNADSLSYVAQSNALKVALTAERYRRDHGDWPQTLQTLTPRYIPELPVDPFTGGPLVYRRQTDGVVIYSVGRDLTDDGGKLQRPFDSRASGVDVGIKLWNVSSRRQPPKTATGSTTKKG